LLSKNIKIKMYRTIILPVVFYGCENCLLTLREEWRLRVFKDRVLRKILGPKKVTEMWRILHNDELNDLYCSPNISLTKSKRRWAGHVARMGERRGAYRVWGGREPEVKRPHRRPRHRWEDSIELDL
jgi:hypothetical protein